LASDHVQARVSIRVSLWRRLILELRRRGRGRNESGAFLLAPRNGAPNRLTSFVCYDDLDPDAYEGGAIAFHAVGHAALWEHCRKKELRVLADVHTHPGSYIQQSSIDQRNPMVPLKGHLALILPNFAKTPWWTLDSAGIYEYLGNFAWRSYTRADGGQPVRLTLW
jgi:proteasome lid subunit RPN8/RPN11